MSDPKSTAVVLTTPYAADTADPLVEALGYWIGEGVGRVLLLFDPRGPGRAHALAAAGRVQPQCQAAGVELTLREVREPETAFYWRWGVMEAFGSQQVETCLLVPGDATHGMDAEFKAGLRQMLQQAAADRLVIGPPMAGPFGPMALQWPCVMTLQWPCIDSQLGVTPPASRGEPVLVAGARLQDHGLDISWESTGPRRTWAEVAREITDERRPARWQ